jgi:hypothetical protein
MVAMSELLHFTTLRLSMQLHVPMTPAPFLVSRHYKSRQCRLLRDPSTEQQNQSIETADSNAMSHVWFSSSRPGSRISSGLLVRKRRWRLPASLQSEAFGSWPECGQLPGPCPALPSSSSPFGRPPPGGQWCHRPRPPGCRAPAVEARLSTPA